MRLVLECGTVLAGSLCGFQRNARWLGRRKECRGVGVRSVVKSMLCCYQSALSEETERKKLSKEETKGCFEVLCCYLPAVLHKLGGFFRTQFPLALV